MGGLFGSMGLDLAFGRPLGETIAGNAFASRVVWCYTCNQAVSIYSRSCNIYDTEYDRWNDSMQQDFKILSWVD